MLRISSIQQTSIVERPLDGHLKMIEGQELTYDEIVDHIVRNKPVPNVVEVPNITLNESLRSASKMAPRLKPWESGLMESREPGADGLQVDLGRSDLPLESAISDVEMVSKYYAMEKEFDNVVKNQQNSNA